MVAWRVVAVARRWSAKLADGSLLDKRTHSVAENDARSELDVVVHPSLHVCSVQVTHLDSIQLSAVLFAIDGLFCMSASLVLKAGAYFGVQRYGKHVHPYPGNIIRNEGGHY